MRGRKTPQRTLEQLRVQQTPGYERRLNPRLDEETLPNDGLEATRLQLRKACCKSLPTTRVEVRTLQVGRPVLKVMKERASDRRKDRIPAQQPK
jgi:hypothetical protein